eukprot:99759_1
MNTIKTTGRLQIECNGGTGSNGQYGGSGDVGFSGQNGKDGKAPHTSGMGAGQTTFGFGHTGTKSGPGGYPGKSGLGGRYGTKGTISIEEASKTISNLSKIGMKKKANDGLNGSKPDLKKPDAPTGGDGGFPPNIGADQMRDKRNFFYKTKTYRGYYVAKYFGTTPPYGSTLVKDNLGRFLCHDTTGDIVESTGHIVKSIGDFAEPTVDAITRFTDILSTNERKRIKYIEKMDETQYRQIGRRDDKLRGNSRKNERSDYREENERIEQIQKRDIADANALNRKVEEQKENLDELMGIDQYEQSIEQLNIEKNQISDTINQQKMQEVIIEKKMKGLSKYKKET